MSIFSYALSKIKDVAEDSPFSEQFRAIAEGAKAAATGVKESLSATKELAQKTVSGIKQVGEEKVSVKDAISAVSPFKPLSLPTPKEMDAIKKGETVEKKGVPLKEVVRTAKEFYLLPAAARTLISMGLDIGQSTKGLITGDAVTPKPFKPKGLLGFLLTATDKQQQEGIKPMSQRIEEAQKYGTEKTGSEAGGLAASAIGFPALTALETLPGGGGKKKGAEKVAETVSDIAKFDPQKYVDEMVTAQTKVRKSLDKNVPEKLVAAKDLLKRKIVDKFAPIEDALNKAQKEGGFQMLEKYNLSDQIDAVLRSPSLSFQFMDDNGLSAAIQQADNLDELNQYLIAKRSLELGEKGIETGRDLAKDKMFVDAVAERVEPTAQLVSDYSKKLLEYTVDRGLVSRELADNLLKENPAYVPINRIIPELGDVKTGASTRQVASLGEQSVVQSIKGSEREIEDPLFNLMTQTEKAFTQGERNRAAQILTSFEGTNVDPFGLRPLITKKTHDIKNNLLSELSSLRNDFSSIKNTYSAANKEDRMLVSFIDDLNKKIDSASEEAIKLFTSGDSAADKISVQKIEEKINFGEYQRKVDAVYKKVREENIKKTERRKVLLNELSKQITKQKLQLKKAKSKFDEAVIRTIEGEKVPVNQVTNAYYKAQDDLAKLYLKVASTIENTKEVVADISSIKPPKRTLKLINNNTKTVKQAVKELTSRNTAIDNLNKKIMKLEQKLETRMAQKDRTEKILDISIENIERKKIEIGRVISEIKKLKPQKKELGEETISVFRNGFKETYVADKQIVMAAKQLDAQQFNVLQQILALPTRIARFGITGANVAFTAGNLPRDAVTALVNGKDTVVNPRVFVEAFMSAVKKDELYKDFIRNAGGGNMVDLGRNAPKQTQKRVAAQKDLPSKVKYVVTNPKEWLRAVEDVISVSEETTRLAQFKGVRDKLIEQGRTAEDAAIIAARQARQATTNFLRSGEWGSALNSAWLYFNAGIQGTREFLGAIKNRPKQTAVKVAASLYFPTAVATAWNLSDEERRKVYADIPDFEKEASLILIPPNPTKDEKTGMWNVIKIPKPPGIGETTNLVRKAFEQINDFDEVGFKDIADSVIGTVSPLGTGGRELMSSLTPQALKPGIQQLTNQNLFTGRPVVPPSLEELPPELQYTDRTSEVAKMAGEKTGISPLRIEAGVKDVFGTLGAQAINTIDNTLAMLGVIDKKDVGGESAWANIKRRFTKAYGGETEGDLIESALQVKKEGDAKRAEAQAKIEAVVDELKSIDPAEANKKLTDIANENPEMAQQIIDTVKDQQKGLTASDRIMKTLGVKNGERAQFIVDWTDKMETSEEKNAFINDLINKGVISETVLKQIAGIVQERNN